MRFIAHISVIWGVAYVGFAVLLRFSAEGITLVIFASLVTVAVPILGSVFFLNTLRATCSDSVARGAAVGIGIALTGVLWGSVVGAVLGVNITSRTLFQILGHSVPLATFGGALGVGGGTVAGSIAACCNYLANGRPWRWATFGSCGALAPPLIIATIIGWPEEVRYAFTQVVIPASVGFANAIVCVVEVGRKPSDRVEPPAQ